MALVDFSGLLFQYKLACSDVGVISNRSHPLSMASPVSPPLEESQRRSMQLRFDLSKHNSHRAVHSAPVLTPTAKGSYIRQKQELDTDRSGKYDSDDYEEFIAQDFEHHRVFVGMDDFMKHVLHVPDDWKTQWGPAIQEVRRDSLFNTCHQRYSTACDDRGINEVDLYGPLVGMINAILEATCKSTVEVVKPKTSQRYTRNDPKKLHHGVLNEAGLSPDVIALQEDLYHKLGPEEIKNGKLDTSFLTWAHPLQVLEVKHVDNVLVDGSHMPRLKVNGMSVFSFPALCE